MSSSSSSTLPRRKCQRVSLKEIEDATANFDERYAIGQGGEAKIYLAQIMLGRSEITQVAVKHLKPNSSGFETEIQIMSKIQHPNIVSLLGYCNDSGQKILIYEYMANGSLADYVQKKQKHTSTTISLSWEQRLKICLGAALGLKHLHAETKDFAKGIIHRDVKPDNILLDANWVAKISDFGMFKLSHADQIDSAMPTMLKGTGGYYAPEYLKYQHVTRKIDVYAFGVVLFQVLCRKMPWDRGDESYYGMEDEDLGEWARQNVDSKIRGEIPDYCLNAFTEIIRKSLSVNPKKRPTMDEVVLTLQDALERQQLKAATEAEGSSFMERWTEQLQITPCRPPSKFQRQQAFVAGKDATNDFEDIGHVRDMLKSPGELYKIGEVSKHNREDDCWIVISGKVYDVTSFLDDHPGDNDIILELAGKDATNDFEYIGHSTTAREMLKEFYVGDVDPVAFQNSQGELYTMGEVCKHNRKGDCWIVISGKIYDVTSFMDNHPGGDQTLLQVAGKDATNDFEDIGHSTSARDMLKDFYVGDVDPSTFNFGLARSLFNTLVQWPKNRA